MSKFFLSVLLCCVLLIGGLIAGCTQGDRTPADTLVVGLSAQPATLDPRTATDATGMRIAALIFTPLVNIGPNLEIQPAAAESWTFKNNVYTLKLRPGLKFSNGRALNKDDVLFSFEQYRQSTSPFASAFEPIESVNVDDADGTLTVKIKLKYFSAKFLHADLPSVKLLPKPEVLAAGTEFSKQLIGTGFYKLLRQDLNEIELEAVANPAQKVSHVKKVLFKIIRDDYTRFQKTLKGELDIVQSELPLDKVSEFEKHGDKFQVVRFPGVSMTYVLLNFKEPMLQKKEVRVALAESLNRAEIIQYKLRGMATPATSILTPNNPDFNPNLKYPNFDLAKAKDVIKAEGLVGKTLVIKASNNPQAVDNAKVIANQLSQTGLNVEVQTFEWGTFYDDIKKGNFQMAIMKWAAVVDPDIYRLAFHSSEKPPGRNRGSYENKKLDPLLEQSFRLESEAKRHAMYQEIQQIVFEDMPIIPLWYEQQVSIVKKNVSGYNPSQMGDYLPFVDVSKTTGKYSEK